MFEDGCGDDLGDECHDVEFGVGGLVVVDDLLVDDAAPLPALGLLEWDVCVACGLGEGVGSCVLGFWWCEDAGDVVSVVGEALEYGGAEGCLSDEGDAHVGVSCRLVGRG